MKTINDRIIDAIKNQLPYNKKLVAYLEDLLDISKESAYRRIRGEIAFSIEELTSVAKDLNLSVDEILGSDSIKRNQYEVPEGILSDPVNGLAQTLRVSTEFVKRVSESENSEVIIAFNHLSLIIHIRLEYVFKFLYYKYLKLTQDFPLNFYFSDLVLPAHIKSLRDEYFNYFQQIKNVTFIIDENTLSRFIKEVLYYYDRKLISKEELLLIQKDLYELIDVTYRMTIRGKNDSGSTINIYLSLFDITSTSSYIEYDDISMIRLWINTITPLNLFDSDIVAVQKKWFTSLKRQSTLITQSGEMQQSEYLNKQRTLIDEMLT